jgi:phosphatase NudJ
MDSQVLLLCSYPTEALLLKETIQSNSFSCVHFVATKKAIEFLSPTNVCAIVAKLGNTDEDYPLSLIQAAKNKNPHIFCGIFSVTACQDAVIRTKFTEVGTNMITSEVKCLNDALKIVKEFVSRSGSYVCPLCVGGLLTEDELLRHIFLYHNQVTQNNMKLKCPVCSIMVNPLPVHLFNQHGACGRQEATPEHELTEVASWGWWLPGGRINQGEDLIQSVKRETKEEAGIDVKITGILRFEYSPRHADARFRVIFFGEPVDENQEPKTLPDFESMAGAWVNLAQLSKIPLRGPEPTEWFNYVHCGGAIHPISILTKEGAQAPPV